MSISPRSKTRGVMPMQKGVVVEYSTEVGGYREPVRIFVAGLGNAPMPNTRHSIGQYIVNSLSTHFGIPLQSGRGGQTGSGTVTIPGASGPVVVTLFKSKQLMNISGPSIVTSYRSSGSSGSAKASNGQARAASASNLVVLGDSISHAPKKLSARLGGSAQGHNGLKSIQTCLGKGTQEFWQFRVGVGRGHGDEGGGKIDKSVDAAQWVLGRLSQGEMEYWGVGGRGLELVVAELGRVAARLEG